MSSTKLEKRYEELSKELAEKIKKGKDKALKDAIIEYAKVRNVSKDEAFAHVSNLYLLYVIRHEMEEDTCKLEDFASHVVEFAHYNGGAMEYYRNKLERVDHPASLFKNMLRKDLLELTKMFGLKGCSSLKKDLLLERIQDEILDETSMKTQLMCCLDESIDLFERIMDEGVKALTVRESSLTAAFPLGYIGVNGNGDAFVPRDVEAVYRRISNEELHTERKLNGWLRAVSFMVGVSYGFVSYKELDTLINLNPYTQINDDNREDYMERMRTYSMINLFEKDGYIGEKELLENETNRKTILKAQELPMGIPSCKEIQSLGIYDYPHSLHAYGALHDYLVKKNYSNEDIKNLLVQIYLIIAKTNSTQFVYNLLDEIKVEKDYILGQLIEEVFVSTRCIAKHGMDQNEFEKYKKQTAKKKKKSKKSKKNKKQVFVPYSNEQLERQKAMEKANGNPMLMKLYDQLKGN